MAKATMIHFKEETPLKRAQRQLAKVTAMNEGLRKKLDDVLSERNEREAVIAKLKERLHLIEIELREKLKILADEATRWKAEVQKKEKSETEAREAQKKAELDLARARGYLDRVLEDDDLRDGISSAADQFSNSSPGPQRRGGPMLQSGQARNW